MLIDSNKLRHLLIDNAIDKDVSLQWVMHIIDRAENECNLNEK